MIIQQLTLQNFMGYRKRCKLDFRGKQTIGIIGENEAGKSTLLAAIAYLLHGKVPALNQETREISLISDNAKSDMLVEGEVMLPSGEELCITRGRTKNNSPIVRLEGVAGKPSEVSEIIGQKLGASWDDFIALTYFVQGDIHQFMDGSKRDYFNRWASPLRRWESYAQAAVASARELEEEETELRQRLAQIKDAKANLPDARRELHKAEAAQAQADETQDLLEQQIDALAAQLAQADRAEAEEIALAAGAVKALAQAKATLATEENRKNTAARQLASLEDNVCPILRKSCERIGATPGAIAEAQKALRLAEAEVRAARKRLHRLDEECRLASKPKAPGSVEDARRELQVAKAEHSSHIAVLNRASVALGRARERVDQLKTLIAQRDDIKARLRLLERRKGRLQFVHFMCGSAGIPMQVMEDELALVEERCNWVLGRLDYHKRIMFSAYRELAGYEKVCARCGGEKWSAGACSDCGEPRPRKRKSEPSVTVLDGAVARPFALESGGARVLQSFAVRLACSLFVSNLTGVRPQMVMLDEVFAMLDASNRQKLMSLIIGKLSSEFGLKQQFIVSHQQDVVNAVDNILIVRRRGGSSVANWA